MPFEDRVQRRVGRTAEVAAVAEALRSRTPAVA